MAVAQREYTDEDFLEFSDRETLPTPTPRQEEVFNVIRRAKRGTVSLIGYGGAMGGAKSWCIGLTAHHILQTYPGANILIGRDELKALRDTTMKEFFELTPRRMIARHNKNEEVTYLTYDHYPEGVFSRIYWRGVHDDSQFRSAKFVAYMLDEVDRVPHNSFETLNSRLRQVLPDGRVPKYVGLCCTNPSPGWFKKVFYDKDEKSTALRDDLRSAGIGEITFIRSFIKDNPHLPPNYEAVNRLMLRGNPERLAAWMDGSFDAYEGQIFTTIKPQRHRLSQEALKTAAAAGLKVATIRWRGEELVIPKGTVFFGGLDFAGAQQSAHWSACSVSALLPNGADVTLFTWKGKGSNVRNEQEAFMRSVQEALGAPVQWVGGKDQYAAVHYLRQKGWNITENEGKPDSWLANVTVARERLHDGKSSWLAESGDLEDDLLGYRMDPNPRPDGSYKERPIEVDDDLVDAWLYSREYLRTRYAPLDAYRSQFPYAKDEDSGLWLPPEVRAARSGGVNLRGRFRI